MRDNLKRYDVSGSTWVEAFAYLPSDQVKTAKPGFGLVLLWTQTGGVYCYAAPPWVFGLMRSAQVRGTSVGRIASRHLIHRFGPGVEASEVVDEAA